LVDDVVNEVYIIYIKKIRTIGDLKKVPYYLRYWILKSVNYVLRQNRCEIKLLNPSQIESYVERIKDLVDEGYSEEEAKDNVIMEESIMRHRLVTSVPIENLKLKPKGCSEADEQLITLQTAKKNAEVIKGCLENWKSRGTKNADRDYHIFIDGYINEEKNNKIAKKYNLSSPRITQITKNVEEFLTKCIKKRLKRPY
jgi:hypothetical protein